MKQQKILGFTLAEVLITLSIIGIIAAITIPILINDYQKTQDIVALKKFYTQFNLALKEITIDYGCADDLRCTDLFTSTATATTLGNELVQYFKVIKNCGTGTGCWPSETNLSYDGSLSDTEYDTNNLYYKFVTIDGVSVLVRNISTNCINTPSAGTLSMSQVCAYIVIDINGLQKPNRYGRDTFYFYITNGRGALLYPLGGMYDSSYGWWNSSSPPKCSSGNPDGMSCAARIMEESWRMNY